MRANWGFLNLVPKYLLPCRSLQPLFTAYSRCKRNVSVNRIQKFSAEIGKHKKYFAFPYRPKTVLICVCDGSNDIMIVSRKYRTFSPWRIFFLMALRSGSTKNLKVNFAKYLPTFLIFFALDRSNRWLRSTEISIERYCNDIPWYRYLTPVSLILSIECRYWPTLQYPELTFSRWSLELPLSITHKETTWHCLHERRQAAVEVTWEKYIRIQ